MCIIHCRNLLVLRLMRILFFGVWIRMWIGLYNVVSFCRGRKWNSYLVRVKLYPLESMVGSYKSNSKEVKFSVTLPKLIHLLVATTKLRLKPIIDFSAMKSSWFTCLLAIDVLRNMQVKPQMSLGVGGTSMKIKLKGESTVCKLACIWTLIYHFNAKKT